MTTSPLQTVLPAQLFIGQTLFIVSDDNIKVIPAIVSEKNVTETLKGDTVTWKVIIGPEHKRKTIAIDKITGDKFATLDEARQELLSRFDLVLDEALEESANNAAVWYSLDINEVKGLTPATRGTRKKTPQVEAEDDASFDADSIVSDIENAPRKATAKVPKKPTARAPVATNSVKRAAKASLEPSPDDSPEERKRKLMEMMTLSDEELLDQGGQQSATPGTKKIIMPDGEEVFVTL